MKKQIYKAMVAMLTLSLVSAPILPVTKSYASENALILQKNPGFQYDGTNWFYVNALGLKITGWITGIDGFKYYLDQPSGVLHTGWLLDSDGSWYFLNTISDGSKGRAMYGWQWIDGYCYYFDQNGKMLAETFTPDKYYVNANGQWSDIDGTVHFISGKGWQTKQVLGASRIIPVTSKIRIGSSGGSSGSSRGSRYRHKIAKINESTSSSNEENNSSDSIDTKSHKEPETTSDVESKETNEIETTKSTEITTSPKIETTAVETEESAVIETNAVETEESTATETTAVETNESKEGETSETENKEAKTEPETTSSSEEKSIDSGDKKPKTKLTVTGFKPLKTLHIKSKGDKESTLAFIRKRLNGSGVTFYLSNNKRTTAKVTDWKIEGDFSKDDTLTAIPTSYKIADKYDSIKDDFYKCDVSVNISVIKDSDGDKDQERPDDHEKEVIISLDREPVGTSRYPKYEYNYDDDITIYFKNYKGDGANITLKGANGFTTTVADHAFNKKNKSVTIPVKEFMPDGLTNSNFWLTAIIDNEKKIEAQIYVSTDRTIIFADKTGTSVSISDVSRKKDFETTVTFKNIPEKDVENVIFKSFNEGLADAISLEKTDTAGVYKFKIPVEYMVSHKSESQLNFSINCEGAFSVSVRLYLMLNPALSRDKYDGYYVTDNPVITLKYFSFENSDFDDVKVILTRDNESKVLIKDTDYTLDKDKKSLTIISSKALGTETLAEDRDYKLSVVASADDESADIKLNYKKDRTLDVSLYRDIVPDHPVYLKINNLNYGESPEDIEVYADDIKLDNCVGFYNLCNQILIPYMSIAKYIEDGQVTLTIKKPNIKSTQITLKLPDYTGDAAPVETAFTDEYGNTSFDLQDDKYPIFSGTGNVSIKVTDKNTPDDLLKHTVVVFHKKGTSASGVPVYLDSYGISKSYSTGEKWLNFSLYYYRKDLGNNVQMDGDKYEIYTLTVYIPGFSTKDIDVALKPSNSYY